MSESKDKNYPRLTSLIGLGFHFNIALQEGNHGVTFEDVYQGLDDGSLWDMLNAKVPNIDVSMFVAYRDQGNAAIAALRDAAEGMRGRERKYGIDEGNGLSLLLAYVLEAIQSEHWVPGSTSRYYVPPPPPSDN